MKRCSGANFEIEIEIEIDDKFRIKNNFQFKFFEKRKSKKIGNSVVKKAILLTSPFAMFALSGCGSTLNDKTQALGN
jgi:hypothetical protein